MDPYLSTGEFFSAESTKNRRMQCSMPRIRLFFFLLIVDHIDPSHEEFFLKLIVFRQLGCRHDRKPLLHVLSGGIALCAECLEIQVRQCPDLSARRAGRSSPRPRLRSPGSHGPSRSTYIFSVCSDDHIARVKVAVAHLIMYRHADPDCARSS